MRGTPGCPAGDTHYFLRDVTVTLNDTGAPSVSQVAGALRNESGTGRVRSLTYAATDAGSGVFRQRLIVDGASRAAETVDSNDGRCAAPFTRRVPCQRDTTGSVTLDTATLSDGHHELQLDVRDATDVNKALHGPWTILVDNVPPTIGAPTLTGVAREGDTLTCAADVQGQSPTVTFQWLRASSDGSGATAIAGATNAAYTTDGPDVGRKLICRVTGRDGGGSASRDSVITQSPFDNGKTVEPYCSGRPTGPRDPCGDLDNDGTVNRLDDDIDGDGVPNDRDVDPYDATKPGAPAAGSGTGGTDTGSGGNTARPSDVSSSSGTTGVPGAGGCPRSAASAAPVGTAGTVRFLLGRDSATFVGRRARWARSAFALKGRLTDASGQPIAGLRLTVAQAVNGKSRELGQATSAADGSWSFSVPRGPSRTVTVSAGDGLNAATMTVRQTVLAHVTFRSVNKRIRRGGRALFRGQLRGGYTNAREKLVEFQVHYRGAWRTIANLRVDRAGRFAVRYRFGTASYGQVHVPGAQPADRRVPVRGRGQLDQDRSGAGRLVHGVRRSIRDTRAGLLCGRPAAAVVGLTLMLVSGLAAGPVSSARADESPVPTAQQVAYGGEWLPYVDPADLPPVEQRPVVCLVDSGVAVTSDLPDDRPEGPIVSRRTIIDGADVHGDPTPEGQHGTRMASMMGALQNGVGTVGAVPWVRVVSVRAMGVGETGFRGGEYRRVIDYCATEVVDDYAVAVGQPLAGMRV